MDDPNPSTRSATRQLPRQPAERAIAPVVGVALLIGITVILVSVVATVVLGTGAGPSETPQTTLSFAIDDDGGLVIAHEGGDSLPLEETVVRAQGGTEYGLEIDDDCSETDDLVTGCPAEVVTATGDQVSAADVDRITVVWQEPGESSESVLATFEP